MVLGLNKNMTKEQIAYSPHDQKVLGQIGIKLTNENISKEVKFNPEEYVKEFTGK